MPEPQQIPLAQGERLDALGRDGLRIIQNPRLFRFTTDAYLLSAFSRPDPGDTVLELGSGSGVVVLLLAGRTEAASVAGVEIQPVLVEMARRNIALNGMEDRASVIQGDLRDEGEITGQYDLVVANPPYIPVTAGRQSDNGPMALAKHELACTLRNVTETAARRIKGRGRFIMVHRPERMPEIMAELARVHLAPKRLAMVHPNPSTPAKTLVIEARAGAKPGLMVCPPLFVRDGQGAFTMEMEEVFAGRWPTST